MSITIRTEPAAIHPAFNPVTWEVETTRTTPATASVSTIANSSGLLLINTTAAHGLANGDVVAVNGLTGLTTGTLSTVAVNSTTQIVCTNIAWSAGYTAAGTVVKTNNQVTIRAEVKFGSILIGTYYSRSEVVSGSYNVFPFDLSGCLSDYIDSIGFGVDRIETADGVAKTLDPSFASTTYTVVFTEFFNGYDGQQVIGSQSTSSAKRAVNMVLQSTQSMATYVLNTGTDLVLTPITSVWLRPGELFTIQAVTDQTSVGVKLTPYTSAGAGTPAYGTKVPAVDNNRVQVTFSGSMFSEGQTRYDLAFYTSAKTVISNTVSIYRLSTCVKNSTRVEWRNLLGGVDSFYVVDRELMTSADSSSITTPDGAQIVYYVTNRRTAKIELTGTLAQLAAYESLLVSRFIWFNGERVELLSRSQTTYSRDLMTWTLEFRIKSLVTN